MKVSSKLLIVSRLNNDVVRGERWVVSMVVIGFGWL